MELSKKDKNTLSQEIKSALISEKEIQKIILFGSFVNSNNPNDIDVAVFQNSNEPYLTLALKYRKLTRNISKKIPLDIIPLKSENRENHWFLKEIENGNLIYETSMFSKNKQK